MSKRNLNYRVNLGIWILSISTWHLPISGPYCQCICVAGGMTTDIEKMGWYVKCIAVRTNRIHPLRPCWLTRRNLFERSLLFVIRGHVNVKLTFKQIIITILVWWFFTILTNICAADAFNWKFCGLAHLFENCELHQKWFWLKLIIITNIIAF